MPRQVINYSKILWVREVGRKKRNEQGTAEIT
jgi:hypothetical protein